MDVKDIGYPNDNLSEVSHDDELFKYGDSAIDEDDYEKDDYDNTNYRNDHD